MFLAPPMVHNVPMFQPADIGIVSIATNKYFDYWLSLVASAYENIEGVGMLEFYLFTDQPEREAEIDSYRDKFNFSFERIPSYGWPDATLKRYQIISDRQEVLINPILMYLDSDMLIREDFIDAVTSETEIHRMNFVRHPGYFRPTGAGLVFFYIRSPRMFLADLFMQIKIGGLGAWETNSKSAAYVPRRNRNVYVCGGTWFGRRTKFLSVVEELRDSVSLDERNFVTAIWHDESHLNKLASENEVGITDSRFCFDPRYANLQGIPNLIEAVNKNN